jgi:uncharacterized caspase-like protein
MVSSRIVGLVLAVSMLVGLGFDASSADAPWPAGSPPLVKERRLALVIGNGDYPNAPLRNPVNDAKDLAAVLADSGFDVIRLENANLRQLRTAVRDFGDRLKKQGGVGLFYFAGHGMQLKGRNYLIPVSAQIEREDEIEFESLDANLVLEKLDSAGNRFNIVILDACRNNPFARAFRSTAQGLAQMDAPSGTVIAFATSPGSVASDGPGRNGLYTQYLIQSVRQPGLKIEDVFKQVRAAVRRDSGGLQTPWESTSLEGDFYFHPIDSAVVEAARKKEEQARLEEAVRVAIAQERERIRRELEDARAQDAIAKKGPAVALPASPGSPRPDTAGELAKKPPTPGPAAVASTAPGLATPGGATAPASPAGPAGAVGAVIGSQIEGKIPAPRFVAGDEWEILSVTTTSPRPGAEPLTVIDRITVLGVSEQRLSLSSTRLDKPGGKPVEEARRFAVSPQLATLFDGKNAFKSQRKYLMFPLEVNARWSYSHEFPTSDGAGRMREDLDCRVVGWEKVVVPAGTFWALRIEETGWLTNLSPGAPVLARGGTRLTRTFWYSPEVKYLVKSTWQKSNPSLRFDPIGGDSQSNHQLIRYTRGAPRPPAPVASTR